MSPLPPTATPPTWQGDRGPVSVKAVNIENPTQEEAQEKARVVAFLQLARDRFRISALAENKRRDEMLTDLRFRAGKQWDEPIEQMRKQQDRPCLTINRIPEFLKHVTNNIRQARPEIKVDPRGDGADEEIAEVRQGLIRHILVESRADIAEDTAFENMCTMGLGYVRVIDGWADETSFDKSLFVEWLPNTFTVYEDPGAIKPDWSDGKYKFIVEDISLAEFRHRFGRDRQASGLDGFKSIGDEAKFWLVDGKVRIAEYWYVEEVEDILCELSDGTTKLFSEIKARDDMAAGQATAGEGEQQPQQPGQPEPDIVRTRKKTVKKIKWALISGVDILEQRDWPGKYIPVIPFIGNQIEMDGEKILVGMVRYARESQRMYNYMYSSFVEAVALAPKAPYVIEFDQLAEFTTFYKHANTQPLAYLPYRAKTVDGQLVPPPQRQTAEPPIAAFVEGLKLCDANLKATFSIYDASLGQKGPQESGIAINSRKVESDTATYDWVDNFHRGLTFLGIVLNDLLEHFYNTPGRIIQIIREDLEQEAVTFNQAFQRQGKPVIYDLSKGKYSVSISTGPAFATKRQEAAQAVLKMAEIYPPFMQACAPDVVRMLDFPEKDRFAKQLEKLMPPQLQAGSEDENQQVPPQFQAAMQQSQQMIQQLTQVVNALSDKKEADREKELWDTFRTQMQQETQLAIAQLKTGSDEAKMLSAELFEEMKRVRMLTEQIMAGQQQPTSSQAPASAAAPSIGQKPQAPAPAQAPTPAATGGPPAG